MITRSSLQHNNRIGPDKSLALPANPDHRFLRPDCDPPGLPKEPRGPGDTLMQVRHLVATVNLVSPPRRDRHDPRCHAYLPSLSVTYISLFQSWASRLSISRSS